MILSNVTVPLVGLVDTAVIGHLGAAHYLGAVAVGSLLYTFLVWVLGFLRMGTTGLVAQAYGRSDPAASLRILAQAALLAASLGLVLLLARHWVLAAGIYWIQPSEAVEAGTASYFLIRIHGLPAALCNIAIVGWFLGVHNARSPLALLLFTNIVNVLLDLLLVLGLDWGLAGAAWASLLSDWLGLALAAVLVWRHCRRQRMLPLPPGWFSMEGLVQLLRVNGDIFIRTLALEMVFLLFTRRGAEMGDVILAANAVLLNFLLIMASGLDGFANAAEALVGRAIGARDGAGYRQSLRACAIWSLLASLVFLAGFALFGGAIIALMTNVGPVITAARNFLPYVTLLPLVAVWSYLLDGVFIGATLTRDMRNAMVLALLLGFLPLLYLTASWGNHGLWLAFYGFMVIRGLSLYLLLRHREKSFSWLPEPHPSRPL